MLKQHWENQLFAEWSLLCKLKAKGVAKFDVAVWGK